MLCRAPITRAVAIVALLIASAAYAQIPGAQDKSLRVCADPNNLPLSHRNLEGYENKIAALFAQELGWKLEYTWFPQRIGFIRNTLRAREGPTDRFKCDLVMGVPTEFELAATTRAYYRSTYAMVYEKGRGLDTVTRPEDLLKLDPARLREIRFGVFAQTPPVDWLLKHRLFEQAISFSRQSGDAEAYPGQLIVNELAEGRIDVAFAWGPIAGYFASRARKPEMAVVPFPPSREIRFDYPIAMAVRFGEKEWRARVDDLIAKNKERIEAILVSYGVPLLDERGELMRPASK
jgi:mxaJ protein